MARQHRTPNQRRRRQQQQQTPEMPAPTGKGEDGDRLTEEDEKILDKVMADITPEDMAASVEQTMRLWADKFPQPQQENAKGE